MADIDNSKEFFIRISGHDITKENTNWKLDAININVPIEIIIMQLKSLVKNYEKNYFGDFDSKFSK